MTFTNMDYTTVATQLASIVDAGFAKSNIRPEALFNIGVDADAQQFAQDLLEQFRGIVSNGLVHQVNCSADLNLNEGTIGLIELVMDIGLGCYAAWAFATRDSVVHCCVAGAMVALRFGHIHKSLKTFGQDNVQAEAFSPATIGLLGGGVLFKLLDGIMHAETFDQCYNYSLDVIKRYCSEPAAAALDVFLTFLQHILDAVCKVATGQEFPVRLIGQGARMVRASLDKINDLTVAKQSNSIALDELAIQLSDALSELEKGMKTLPKGSALLGFATQTATSANRALIEIRTILGSSSGSRIEPVCYVFVGPPGIGKTMFNNVVCDYFVYELSSTYMKEYYKRDSAAMHRQIYSFDQTDQYFSGYRNQLVGVIDEVEPQPAASGMVSMPSRLIRLVNSASCPLNMADLGSKGNTWFSTRVLVGTTNNYNWANLPGVSNVDAFYRRVNFVSSTPDLVALQRDFGNGQLRSFEELKPAMQDYMQHQFQKYKAKELDLSDYLDTAYKYIRFAITKPNAAGTISSANGVPILPSELIRRVVREAKMKEEFAGNRVDLTTRIIEERSMAIEAQSAILGSIKDILTRRYYNVEPSDRLLGENGAQLFPTIWRAIARESSTKDCVCQVCLSIRNFNHVDNSMGPGGLDATEQYALEVCRLIHVPTISEADIYQLREELRHGPRHASEAIKNIKCFYDLLSTSVRGDRMSAAHIFVDAHIHFSYYAHEYANGVMSRIKRMRMKEGIIRFAKDVGLALIFVKMAQLAWSIAAPEKRIKAQGDYPMRPRKKERHKTPAITVRVHEIQPEGGPDDLMYSLARTNVYKFSITSGKPGVNFVSHFTMVQNQLALTPLHTVRGIIAAFEYDPDAVMVIEGCVQPTTSGYTSKRQEIPLCNLIVKEGDSFTFVGGITEVCRPFVNPEGVAISTDMCMVTIPVSARARHTAFHTEDFFSEKIDHVERNGSLVTIGDNGGIVIEQAPMYPERNWQAIKCSNNFFGVDVDDDETNETHWFGKNIVKYVANTRVGFCGAPIFMKRNGTYRIVGIHVAGSVRGGWGYGIVVSAEDIARTIKLHLGDKDAVPLEPSLEEVVAESAFVVDEGESTKFGHVEAFKVKAARVPTRTSLAKSPLYDLVDGPPRAPAILKPVLRDGQVIDPIAKAQEEYGNVTRAPRLWIARMCMDNVFRRMMRSAPLPGEKYIPTYEETICPGELFPFTRSVPRGTSPGYPYCLSNKKKGKLAFFGEGQDYEFTSNEWFALVAEADAAKAKILRGERPLFINLSFPKDERRSVEKVEQVKTRLISGGSVLFTMLLRQCTMGFFNFIVRTRGTSGIAIGTNPYSEDWDALANRMGAIADQPQEANCIAGDFSGFDKKLHYVWIMEVCRIITKFYGDEGSDVATIRKALFYEIAFSRHVVGNAVVEWVGSNPSGQSMTTPTNSAANAAMLRYALVLEYLERICDEVTEASVDAALEVMFHPERPAIQDEDFGDDSLIAVLDMENHLLSWVDGISVSEAFEKHLSVKYTDESKSDVQQARRTLSECTFLKRGFVQSGVAPSLRGRFLAPLELDSILDSVRWFKPKSDGSGLTEWADNVTHMIEELSLHGPEIYTKHGNQIIDACMRLEIRPQNLPMVLPPIGVAQVACCSREMEY